MKTIITTTPAVRTSVRSGATLNHNETAVRSAIRAGGTLNHNEVTVRTAVRAGGSLNHNETAVRTSIRSGATSGASRRRAARTPTVRGIAGEVRLDGRPADASAVARMAAAMEARGPDGVGLWSQVPSRSGSAA